MSMPDDTSSDAPPDAPPDAPDDVLSGILDGVHRRVPFDTFAQGNAPGVIQPAREFPADPTPDPRRHPWEVYIVGYTNSGQGTASVQLARGTVLNSDTDLTDIATITGLDTTYTLTTGEALWVHAVFNSGGAFTTLAIEKGAPTASFFVAGGGGGNECFYPIAQVLAFGTGKNGPPTPNSGEFPQLGTGYFIAQKCNTHLVKVRMCIGSAMTQGWVLMPGPGGWG